MDIPPSATTKASEIPLAHDHLPKQVVNNLAATNATLCGVVGHT
ncbi:hypothetical protein [Parapedobacter tibetensis]|nr:hypothetical protein [Parapedobacter tibetensis]